MLSFVKVWRAADAALLSFVKLQSAAAPASPSRVHAAWHTGAARTGTERWRAVDGAMTSLCIALKLALTAGRSNAFLL